jgi:hypothetical protein
MPKRIVTLCDACRLEVASVEVSDAYFDQTKRNLEEDDNLAPYKDLISRITENTITLYDNLCRGCKDFMGIP